MTRFAFIREIHEFWVDCSNLVNSIIWRRYGSGSVMEFSGEVQRVGSSLCARHMTEWGRFMTRPYVNLIRQCPLPSWLVVGSFVLTWHVPAESKSAWTGVRSTNAFWWRDRWTQIKRSGFWVWAQTQPLTKSKTCIGIWPRSGIPIASPTIHACNRERKRNSRLSTRRIKYFKVIPSAPSSRQVAARQRRPNTVRPSTRE